MIVTIKSNDCAHLVTRPPATLGRVRTDARLLRGRRRRKGRRSVGASHRSAPPPPYSSRFLAECVVSARRTSSACLRSARHSASRTCPADGRRLRNAGIVVRGYSSDRTDHHILGCH